MPELPEVEAARKAIQDHCLGRKIRKAIIADDSKVIQGVSPSDFEAAIVGKTLISALRKGKNLWLQLDSPPFPSFQFGMTGAIYIKGVAVTKYKRSAVNDTDEWPSKYSKLFIELDDGLELSFTDKRRFARVRLLNDPSSVPPVSELGPDALLELMTVSEFYESLCKKKIAIKALLLDQGFISGIGNWIADEVLYQARIHPLQIASSLTKESCSTLLQCIKEVIQFAVQVDAASDRFPLEWLFHFRWGKKAGNVNGKKIDFISAGGRTTAYVPDLQKLRGKIAKAVDKSKRQTSKKKNDEDSNDKNGEMIADDVDEAASKKDDTVKNAKSRRELKAQARSRKHPTKQKPVPNGGNNAEEDYRAAASDMGEEEYDTVSADNDAEEDDQKREQRRTTNGKAEVKNGTTQNSKKRKKAE